MDQIYEATNAAAFAYTGAQTKTLIKVKAGAAFVVKIHEIGITFDGVTSSAVPATVALVTSSEGGAGTATSITPVQIKGFTVAHGTTCEGSFTAEPTTLTIVRQFFVPQFMGSFVIQYPLGLEPQTTDVSKGIGLRVTSTATVNALSWIKFSRA